MCRRLTVKQRLKLQMARAQSGLHQLLLAREIGVVGSQEGVPYQRSLHFPPHYAGKLSVAHTYNGHSGCVNRLAWNADGSLLVSGSDDRRAIIWHHPEVERTPLALSTEHRANIFGVQFLPCTGDRRVITGAMDDTVQLHDLEASPATNIPRPGSAGGSRAQPPMHRRVASTAHLQSVMPRTKVYYSHKDRVKDVRVEPMNPHNFWSGGEDGVVRQYDTRQPNQDKWESPTVLVQVRDGHKTIQVKSLDINKAHPHLLAVAGSDPQIRLYDRRKLSTGGASPLCPRAEEAKARGNAAMFERKWTAAVVAFTDALHWAPGAPALYAQRAEALLGRGWVGDAAMALRDCDTAVGLDESFSRAYLRRIHALQALQQYQCALTAVDEYQRRFPGRAADDVAALAVTLRAAVEERRRLYEARRQQQERRRAQRARFVGQSNVQTDIKEVGFIGSDDAVVAAGSDCGRVYLYDAASGAVLRALPADEDVANCVQCHPSLPVIATSGIETVVRLWSPSDALPSPAAVRELTDELDGVVGRNQERMKEGPSMLRTSALQQALQENPQLWQLLMSQLYGRGVMAARSPNTCAACGGRAV
eukprot:XP_001702569.1 predicted protein [Chlamydomonas reinhardtii]